MTDCDGDDCLCAGPAECVAYPKWHRPLCESGGTTSALCRSTCVHVTPAHLGAPRGRRDTDQARTIRPISTPSYACYRPQHAILTEYCLSDLELFIVDFQSNVDPFTVAHTERLQLTSAGFACRRNCCGPAGSFWRTRPDSVWLGAIRT